ncbi:MAG: hypothetical protein NZ918_05220 [Aigarchaeota archaeon]|nr:hypothetical protein [Aigarchaeota archaeon]
MTAYAFFFKGVLERVLGRSSLAVLEYQLSKRVAGADPYELLLKNPQDFCRALAHIFGASGSCIFLRLVFKYIIDEYALTGWNPDELAKALVHGGGEAKQILLSFLENLPIIENECVQVGESIKWR